MTKRRFKRKSKLFFGQLSRRVNYRESSEALSLVLSAVVVGLLAGFGVVVFDTAVRFMTAEAQALRQAFGGVLGTLVSVLTPALGGLVITPIVLRWAPDVRGSGIPQVMLEVSNGAGRLPKRLIFWRPFTSALSIGSGAALGSEGPVVQLSAAIASLVGDAMRLTSERRRNLVAVAAAGGISAVFNAPIAGMLFALEAILGKFSGRYVASVVVGSVAASVVSRAFLGPAPAFAVPDYGLGSPLELPLYFALGILSGLFGIAIIRNMVWVEDMINRLNPPSWLRPALGGLALGLIGLILPQILGRGYDVTASIINNHLSAAWLLLAIALVKMLSMNISLGSYHSGGIFAPILLMGAAFGGAFGHVAQGLFPSLIKTPGAYALVGMAAAFAGAERAPMTTIVLVFEMSGDYNLILPLLLATVLAMLMSELFQEESIYHVMLSRKGLSLWRRREADLLQTVAVREVMEKEVPTLLDDRGLKDLVRALVRSHHHGFVLMDHEEPEHMVGIVTLSDLERARKNGASSSLPVSHIASKAVHSALPGEPISEVLERMAALHIGRMPVVDPTDRHKPIGFVRQADLARAYYQAVQRQRVLELSEEALRLRNLSGQEIVEVKVRAACPLAGKMLRDAGLPQESIVVAIRRSGKTIFPHGDTVLKIGDTVVASVASGRSGAFRHIFARPAPAREGTRPDSMA